MKNALYTLFAFTLLLACSKPATTQYPKMTIAEDLMRQHPDSALSILTTMTTPSPTEKAQYATWCLLLTQAQDKSYILPTSDSLIQVAVRYFEKQQNLQRKATALYYAGRIQDELYNKVEAAEYYVMASDVAKKTEDYHLISLISNHLGILYLDMGLENKALEQQFLSYTSDSLAKDTIGVLYSLREIGTCYLQMDKLDSAFLFYQKALDLSRQQEDILAAALLNDIAIVYRRKDQLEKAIAYFRKAIEKTTQETNLYASYSAIGTAFFMQNKLDSASYYLTQAVCSDYIYTKAGSYKQLYELEKIRGNYQLAIDYNDLYTGYKAQIDSFSLSSKVAEIQIKYDQTKLLNDKQQLELDKAAQHQIGSFLLSGILCLLILSYYMYQRRLKEKEQDLLNMITKIESLKKRLSENEELNEKNESLRAEITGLEEKYQNEAENSKTIFLKKIEMLMSINGTLSQNEKLLIDCLIKQSPLLKQVRLCATKRIAYKTTKWEDITVTTDRLFGGLLTSLQHEYPKLVDEDIQICSLLLLNIKLVEIAYLMSEEEDCINKRTERIRKKLSIKKPLTIVNFLMCKWRDMSGFK